MIKLPNPNPPMNEPQNIPMDNMGMGDNDINNPMDNNMPSKNDMEGNGEENEGNEPKKNVQHLAGELSQALRMYNQQQTQPDTDLNKYVMGMVVAQAAKDMTSKEKDEIIKKIQNGESEENTQVEECKDYVNEINNSPMEDDEQKERFEKKTSKRNNPFIANR